MERNTPNGEVVGFGDGEMMTMDLNHGRLLSRWLAAERGGREGDAETVLGEMFALLPSAVPSPGFAGRVLVAAGCPRPAPMGWGLRLLTAAALVATGLTAAIVGPWMTGALRMPSAGSAIETLAEAVISLVDKLVTVLTIGRYLSGLGEALWAVVTSPVPLAVLLVLAAISAALLRWLEALLAWERNDYAEAH